MVLVIKNISFEGPGTIGQYLESTGQKMIICDLSMGDVLPENLSDFSAVIALGGPMNVYEEKKHSFLASEISFIKKTLNQNIPFLGICLGSQLLAVASGADVVKSPNIEIGWGTVDLTDEGLCDPFFEGLPRKLSVFQWHSDMFDVPEGGFRLAFNDLCPHQAFRVGSNAYGLQFHCEITEGDIVAWVQKYIHDHSQRTEMTERMIKDYGILKTTYHDHANMIYQNFFEKIV